MHVRSIILFFYYMFLEEKVTLKATYKVLRKQKKQPLQAQNQRANLILSCMQVWQKYQKYNFANNKDQLALKRDLHHKKGFMLPPVDLSSWCDFLQETDNEVICVVIFSKILLFSDEDIAKGMNISVGTVRYRLAHGLRSLGHVTYPCVTPL